MLREDITGRVPRTRTGRGGLHAGAGGPPAARHRQRVDGLVVAAHDGGRPAKGSGIKTAPSVTVTRPSQSHVHHSHTSTHTHTHTHTQTHTRSSSGMVHIAATHVFKSPLRDSEMMLPPDHATPTCII